MAAQVPQSFRNRPHPSNKPLHLHQIGLNFGVVLSVCSTSRDLVPCEVLQIFAVDPMEREA
jgi:hypothetical protein